MADIHNLHLRKLQGRLGDVLYEFSRLQFSTFCVAETWSPRLNAYVCDSQITICVELAGVEKSKIDLRVEPRSLLIRGRRRAPEPTDAEGKPAQVLAMEIDYGPFAREITLPMPVDPKQVRAEQRNGLLWIFLPLLPHA